MGNLLSQKRTPRFCRGVEQLLTPHMCVNLYVKSSGGAFIPRRFTRFSVPTATTAWKNKRRSCRVIASIKSQEEKMIARASSSHSLFAFLLPLIWIAVICAIFAHRKKTAEPMDRGESQLLRRPPTSGHFQRRTVKSPWATRAGVCTNSYLNSKVDLPSEIAPICMKSDA